MKMLRAWLQRLKGLFGEERRETGLAEEIESHLALHCLNSAPSRRPKKLNANEAPPLEHFVSDLRFSIRQLRRSPGFALTAVLVLALGMSATDWIRFVGRPYDGKHIEVNEREVSAEFFQTFGAKLLRGRYFTDVEDESHPNVVIIHQTLANKYFPGQDSIGRQDGDTNLTPKSLRTAIGVVEDIRRPYFASTRSLDSRLAPGHPQASFRYRNTR